MAESDLQDRAFDELSHEATRDPALRDQLRGAYALLVKALAAAIRRRRRPRAGDSGGEVSLETVEAENAALRRRVRELEEERTIDAGPS